MSKPATFEDLVLHQRDYEAALCRMRDDIDVFVSRIRSRFEEFRRFCRWLHEHALEIFGYFREFFPTPALED